MINVSGQVYEGIWKDGLMEGQGRAQFMNGDIYEGSWQAGKISGFGILKMLDGKIYEGNFLMNEWNTFIRKLTFPNGDVLEGEWDEFRLVEATYTKAEEKMNDL